MHDRSPGTKFVLALLIGIALSIPLFAVWLLVYDRQTQSEFAQASIAEGWGGPQTLSGPVLVIPYRATSTETVTEGASQITRSRQVWRELTLAPEHSVIDTQMRPDRRTRAIYEVVVYEADTSGRARFAVPPDLTRFGVALADLDLARAELRFGLSDPRGLGANPRVSTGGRALRLQPGSGGNTGFFAWLDASALAAATLEVDYAFAFRGHRSLALAPQAGETSWRLRSAWPHPSFQGSFLPARRQLGADGFDASYRIGNLALGESLVATGEAGAPRPARPVPANYGTTVQAAGAAGGRQLALVSLLEPVDLYSRVNRAAKYGFLFIGFTFLAFLLFDIIGGVRVSSIEYLLVGVSLILFFVLLLAFAEVIGFAPAYVLASAAIAGLNTLYSAALLKSWRRAAYIGTLLVALYALLYILLSLEEYSLLIGSMMLFAALAAVMYLTRNLDWAGRRGEVVESAAAG
ncbi:MAG: cell envelope integrity protein CreD [Sphingosinicella sp.]